MANRTLLGVVMMLSACSGKANSAEVIPDHGGSGGSDERNAVAGTANTAGATSSAGSGGSPSGGLPSTTGGLASDDVPNAGSTNGGSSNEVGGAPLDVAGRPKLRGLARSASTYVAVGAAPDVEDTMHGAIYVSSDGIVWSYAKGYVDAPLTDVAYVNGVFVAIGGTSDTAYVSSDGELWQRFQVGTVIGLAPRFAFGNGVFLAVSDGKAHRSSNGSDWEALPAPSAPTRLAGTVFAAGVFAAFSTQDKSVAITTTGDSWTVVNAGGQRQWISQLFSVNDHFVGLGWFNCCFGETGGPWYSTLASNDGFVWTQTPETAQAQAPRLVPILEDEHVCVMRGPYSVSTGPSCREQTWTDSNRFGTNAALKGDGFYLLAGNGILYGTNGNDWTQVIEP